MRDLLELIIWRYGHWLDNVEYNGGKLIFRVSGFKHAMDIEIDHTYKMLNKVNDFLMVSDFVPKGVRLALAFKKLRKDLIDMALAIEGCYSDFIFDIWDGELTVYYGKDKYVFMDYDDVLALTKELKEIV